MQTTPKAVTIRRLGKGDLARLAALSTKLDAETADDWSERLHHSDVVVLGAEVRGALVGYAAGEVRRSFGRAHAAGWFDAFGVDLSQRGQGVGRELAAAFLAELRSRGADHVFTLVPLHDRTLGPFFRGLGFRDESLVCLGRDL
ncbi:MAG TPA: GNAT family N-acetyltransferase [Candidatus Limnocylindria bacterium]